MNESIVSNVSYDSMKKEDLLRLIQNADKEYYLDDNPSLSDSEYDKMRSTYIKLYGESDLDYVPGDVKEGLEAFTHPQRISSLDKVKAQEKKKLHSEISRLFPVIVEDKLDGLTVVIYSDQNKGNEKSYRNGIFAVTRGKEGLQGEILQRFMPKYDLSKVDVSYPIRGEVVMSWKAFEEINSQREKEGLEKYKHPRNASAGIIRSLQEDPNLDKLDFIAYDLIGCDLPPSKQIEILKERTPFPVADYFTYNSVEEVEEAIPHLFEERKEKTGIPLDGIVVKSDVEGSLKKFGETKHHPLNAFAWKAFQDEVETTLREIVPQVGRSKVTLVAKFDPVIIDGTEVSAASVANIGIIRKLGLTIGAKILVYKANQIIPQISEVLEDGDTEYIPPTVCPCCGHKLYEENDVLYCLNNSCRERLVQNVDYLASKKVLDIRGLSEATINKLIDMGYIKNLYDIFDLKAEHFLSMEGFQEKSTNNLISRIQSSRENVDLAHYVASCCIPMVGIDIGEKLMKEFKTYEVLLDKVKDPLFDFTYLEDIGAISNNSLHSDEFVSAFENLHQYIHPTEYVLEKSISSADRPARSYTFVVTGTLSIPRDEMKKRIKDAGSKVTGSVSKKTDFLVLGASDGKTHSKEETARSLGVKIISESELRELLNI